MNTTHISFFFSVFLVSRAAVDCRVVLFRQEMVM